MATVLNDKSHTFSEYLLLPNLTSEDCIPANVSLKTPIVRYKKNQENSALYINTPLSSAIMQSVSDDHLAVALARQGGISFIYASQSIESQAMMVTKVKRYKAGVVESKCNLKPDDTLADVLQLKEKTGHSTVAVTADGLAGGKLLGLVTSRDYRLSRMALDAKVSTFMTAIDKLIYAEEGISLSEANDIIWEHKLNQLPIVDQERNLIGLVFRKDYSEHKENPLELLDKNKRLIVGAGINTKDYRERVPALVEAGADILCIDSSDGFSHWQGECIKWVKKHYPHMPLGAGNVVDAEAFNYLATCGADFIKVGIGGGSICITRETKGIGRGQASALLDVANARDIWYKKYAEYIPICSDGGIVYDYHMTLALAMGADFLMLGRYFARFDESPGKRLFINGAYVKEYWGEGSNRARNWQRYNEGKSDADKSKQTLVFEEGVDSYVPYAGSLKSNLDQSMAKIKSTMCSCGSLTLQEFQKKARLVLISQSSIVEGSAHDVIAKEYIRK